MKEKIRVRFHLQMAAVLHLSMRRGEQCKLASAALAILARHPHKGHTLATLHGNQRRFYAHLQASLMHCLPLSWLHHSLPQANIALRNSLATWVYCCPFPGPSFLPHLSEFPLPDFPSTLLGSVSAACTFPPSPGRTVFVGFILQGIWFFRLAVHTSLPSDHAWL